MMQMAHEIVYASSTQNDAAKRQAMLVAYARLKADIARFIDLQTRDNLMNVVGSWALCSRLIEWRE